MSDFEATRRGAISGEFLDLCNKCFSTLEDVEVEERSDLKHESDEDEEWEDV